jgi:hypothetical protein
MPRQRGVSYKAFDGLDIVDSKGHHRVARPELIEAALKIANVYQQRSGKNISKKSLICFYLAAEKCAELGETPEEYATKQLQGMLRFGILYPQALCSDVVRQAADVAGTTVDTVQFYKAMLESYQELRKVYGPRILNDPSADFTPLFRYCMLVSNNMPADDYLDAAKVELAANPVVNDIFSKFIPT